MNNYRNLLGKAKKLLENAAAERAQVADEGRTADWNIAQYQIIKDKYQGAAQKVADEMFKTALTDAINKKKEAEEVRKGKSNKPGHGNEKLYHLERAKVLLENLSAEDAIREYGFIASTLEGTEKDFRHIYEDTLSAKVGNDDVLKISANEEIFKYKSEEEKRAIDDFQEAWRLKEAGDTVVNHFLYDIEQVTSGHGVPRYDYTDFLVMPTQGQTNKVRSIQTEESVKQAMKTNFVNDNPYVENV